MSIAPGVPATSTPPPRERKPVLLTVDDDPAVSRGVARDLRRHYGDTLRVVRAESGADALEAMRDLALRGEQVAIVLADYRMPGMNGIEFLEQAMDLFPSARRALLTAYADTDAAIQAINVVDVDHYLLKPWEPPEEKLYPVVDALLEMWRATAAPPACDVRLVGHRWSPRSHEVRDFLARNAVPYMWVAADSAAGVRLLVAAGVQEGEAASAVPLVVTTDGRSLRSPSDTELAAHVGLATLPTEDFYDLVIVGGGPAGLGAAVYSGSEGLRTLLVERHATGGQAGTSSRIENYLGFPDGISGGQLTDRARRQATKFGVEVLTARAVQALRPRGAAHAVVFEDGTEVVAHSVLLATGVAYRRLPADGADELTGRGVFYGSAQTEAPATAGQHVVVVGGANSAAQAALFLARHADRVTLVVRGDDLARSMSSYLVDRVLADPVITVRTRSQVVGCRPDEEGSLVHVLVADSTGELSEGLDATFCFVFIGAAPLTDWLDGSVNRDPSGFVLSGPDLLDGGRRPPGWVPDRDPWYLETSTPGVFVAGDVRSASVKRVASAVGEGAMAVTLVHRYLEGTS